MSGRYFTSVMIATLGSCTISSAYAEGAVDRVAIVNLSRSADAVNAARSLRVRLTQHPDLEPIPPGDLSRALELSLPSAPTTPAPTDLAEKFGAAQSAMARFDHKQAIALLRSAIDEAPAAGIKASEVVDAVFLLGRAQLKVGNNPHATASFRTARFLNAENPDPIQHPPEVVAAWTTATVPLPTAKLSLTSEFDGASVRIDGRSAGTTPLSIDLEPGRHWIRVSREGHEPTVQWVVIGPTPTRLQFKLTAIAGAGLTHAVRRAHTDTSPEFFDAIAKLTSAPNTLVIVDRGNQITVRSHRNRKDVGEYTQLGAAISALVPTHRPVIVLPPAPAPKPAAPWYRKHPWWMASGGAAAVLTGAAIFVFTRSSEHQRTIDGICFTDSCQ